MNYINDYPNLLELYWRNTPKAKTSLLKHLTTPPSESDGIGYCYGFTRSTDRNRVRDHYIKLGFTQNDVPDNRIKQLRGIQSFTIRYKFCKKLERVIHYFFAFARIKRPSPFKTGSEETEWFHFEDNYSPDRVRCFTNEIAELVGRIFGNEYDEEEIVPDLPPVPVAVVPEKFNLNTCSFDELITLKYVGTAKANAIIAYRKKMPYVTLEDVMNISGIKQQVFGSIKEHCYC